MGMDRADSGERAARALSFGQAATLYDRWRPGYPDALYADVLALAPSGRILEAGAGTGKATVELARRGASVLAIEPDPSMAAIARRHTSDLPVEVRESRFEDCDVAAGSFDLVVAAQSWHWVDRERGPAVAARALRDRGTLCLWLNRPREFSGEVWDAIHEVYAEQAPELDRRGRLSEQPEVERRFAALVGFDPWSMRAYDWTATYDAESYAGLVGTHSDHLQLSPAVRTRLLEGIRSAIDDVGGGDLHYRYRTVLLSARVAASSEPSR